MPEQALRNRLAVAAGEPETRSCEADLDCSGRAHMDAFAGEQHGFRQAGNI